MNERIESTLSGKLKKKIKGIKDIIKLAGDASAREYYRIILEKSSFVAMVYPDGDKGEIERVRKFTEIYRDGGMSVPEIVDQIGSNILIQEDIGDISLQRYLSKGSENDLLIIKKDIHSILEKLKSISSSETGHVMDTKKFKFEIDFFIENFVKRLVPEWKKYDELIEEITGNIKKLSTARIFAHRDFHSRNIFVKDNTLFLIDFQDSLQAPEFYDAVSFVFDSYMKTEHSVYFFSLFENLSESETEQVYLTAYQRNIKALGTFGYQNHSGNVKFFSYIVPTINNLKRNIYYSDDSMLGSLFSQFKESHQI